MRIDSFLNAVNLVKRRATAQDMIAHDAVLINGAIVKASREVRVGDVIELKFLTHSKRYEALALPVARNIPKAAQKDYIKEIA
ncbi:MAG: RNA-binding S4 domain-containing protein [Helicobacteraceae bacterium]|jgi:ribosomal 50S subunit-recycling heat shock protein|nr:RNA-binding S4 domain-containing protein [Helicobacteraceae bacterium]